MATRCESCGADLSDDATFCTQCATPVPRARLLVCPLCGVDNPLDSKFCKACAVEIRSIQPGIPLSRARHWRTVFAEIGLLPIFNEKELQILRAYVEKGKEVPFTALQGLGIAVPDDDANDPWVFVLSGAMDFAYYKKHHGSPPVAFENISLYDATGKQVWRGASILAVSRTRIGAAHTVAHAFTRPTLDTFAAALSDVVSADAQLRSLSLGFRDGKRLFLQWKAKGFPLLPQWLTAIAVLAQDTPVNAYAIADMDAKSRSRRASDEADFAFVMRQFADDILKVGT